LSFNQQNNKSFSQEIYALPPRLQSLGRKLLRLPLFRYIKPYARQVAAVTEVPGKLLMRETHERSASCNCGMITVMSANLWHDWPLYRRLPERLNAFAHLVEEQQTDVLLLQEVVRKRDLHVGEWLADRLGMACVYSRANGHESIGFEEGLAVLSRYPLSDPQIKELSSQKNPFVRRLALGAAIDTPCGGLSAFSVHLGLMPRDNIEQQEQLRQLVNGNANGKTVVVGGDFNAHESTPQIEQAKAGWVDTYRHLHPYGEAHTHTLRLPWGGILSRRRLDYIFLHSPEPSWQVVETLHITTPGKAHSDHHAVVTRLASLN
jgi:endonuclease/exonuclease/phosphatase family metal-dependent hydrolase